MTTKLKRLVMRRGTAADWTAANPALAAGEFGVETDTGKVKLGDGVTLWSALPYATMTPAEIDGAIGSATYIGASVYDSNSNVNIPNATWTEVAWNSSTFDTDGFHSPGTNPARLTVPAAKAGFYRVSFAVRWGANATGNRDHRIRLNGSTTVLEALHPAPGSSSPASYGRSTVALLAAGDYVTLEVQQGSGGLLALVHGSGGRSYLEMAYLGAA